MATDMATGMAKATSYTDTYFIVASATPEAKYGNISCAAYLNQQISSLAPSYGQPLQQPLRVAGDSTNKIVAYWVEWTMQPSDLQLLQSGAFSKVNAEVVPMGGTPDKVNYDCWLFDATTGWTSGMVLTAMGYDILGWSGP